MVQGSTIRHALRSAPRDPNRPARRCRFWANSRAWRRSPSCRSCCLRSRYARLANAAREGVAIHDLDRIVEANASFAEMFGYGPDEVTGKAVSDLIAPEARGEALARAKAGGEEPLASLGLRKDGSRFPVEVCGTTIDRHGRSMRVCLVRDLTAQKKAEQRLRVLESELLHASRLTEMGQMAAALAHELTQPLTADERERYRGGRFSRDRRSSVPAIRIDEEPGDGYRPLGLPRDRRCARRADLGGTQLPRRHHLPIHDSDRGSGGCLVRLRRLQS